MKIITAILGVCNMIVSMYYTYKEDYQKANNNLGWSIILMIVSYNGSIFH